MTDKTYKSAYLLILLACYFLAGCLDNSKDKVSNEIITVKPNLKENPKNIHDIGLIRDVEVISLDCDEVIIGPIDKVIKFGSMIYILDKSQNNSIYIFDVKGNYINSISKHGNGPDEYIQLTDIFIDSMDSSLNIVSRVDEKIFKYDSRGEELKGIIKTDKPFTSITKMNKGYIGYMGNWIQDKQKSSNLWILDKNLKPKAHYFEIDESWESRNHNNGYPFSNYNDTYYYTTPMDYNIYEITDESVLIKYSFDLGEMQWPNTSSVDIKNDNKRRELINQYIHRFHYFQETENHLIVHFIFKGQNLLGVYNKNSKEANIVSLNPYEGKYFFSFGNIIGIDEETLYTSIDAWNMKRIWDGKDEYNNFEKTYPNQVNNLREKFKTMREDGNPFLVMYSLQ